MADKKIEKRLDRLTEELYDLQQQIKELQDKFWKG